MGTEETLKREKQNSIKVWSESRVVACDRSFFERELDRSRENIHTQIERGNRGVVPKITTRECEEAFFFQLL